MNKVSSISVHNLVPHKKLENKFKFKMQKSKIVKSLDTNCNKLTAFSKFY